ncbi:MAG: hypothetical protein IJS13_05670 [Paludibacteraceae bacterium]|nr:hypothetical protein [Paludibacteraceae bacterium]
MLILIAEQEERKLIEQYLPEFRNAEVLITGVGALNILRSLRDVPVDTPIVNIGYAGSANFEIGTLVEVTEARLNHPNVSYPEPEYRLPDTGDITFPETKKAVCYTGVDFCLQSDYKDCVFDMELAFILGMGFTNVRALKLVSDNLSLHDYRKLGQGV